MGPSSFLLFTCLVAIVTVSSACKSSGNAAVLSSSDASTSSQGWQYGEDADKMRNVTKKWAKLASTSKPAFILTLRTRPDNGLDMFVTSPEGVVFDCLRGVCIVPVKFDDGNVEKLLFASSTDVTGLFVREDEEKAFLSSLKKAKRLMAEVSVLGQGEVQVEFDLQNLKWERLQGGPIGSK
jgi:hypothetical protein